MEELEALAKKGFELIKDISNDSRNGLNVQDEYYDYLFDVIQSEFDSLESVYILSQQNKFKDCFRILRSVFEITLFFWLMVHGKKYRIQKSWLITPKENSNPEARDKTLQKWKEGKRKGEEAYKNIIAIEAEGEDKIKTVYEYEGMYEEKDETHSGDWIPFYWAVLTEHYDSYTKFNTRLPSIKTGNIVKEEKTKENVRTQAVLYSKYIHIDAIIKNLLLNELITKTQEDYVRVHYNFLSNFVHPTKEAFQFKPNTMGFFASDIPDKIVQEQILLYICRIQYHLLKILLERIDSYNPQAKIQHYKDLRDELNHRTNEFWFIDNKPSKYDVVVSNQRKNIAKRFAGKELDEIVMYYENPIQRLYQMKNWTAQWG